MRALGPLRSFPRTSASHRTANEREMDLQNEIIQKGQELLALGGSLQQKQLAERVIRTAEGRLKTAWTRVQTDRAKERGR